MDQHMRMSERASIDYYAQGWNNSHLLKGDVVGEVAKLKEQHGGEIQVHGNGNLLKTLLKHDLLDTLRIWQFPVVLGTGKRLFGEVAIPLAFRLVESQQTSAGAVLHVYERAGKLRYGEVEVDQGNTGLRLVLRGSPKHTSVGTSRPSPTIVLGMFSGWPSLTSSPASLSPIATRPQPGTGDSSAGRPILSQMTMRQHGG